MLGMVDILVDIAGGAMASSPLRVWVGRSLPAWLLSVSPRSSRLLPGVLSDGFYLLLTFVKYFLKKLSCRFEYEKNLFSIFSHPSSSFPPHSHVPNTPPSRNRAPHQPQSIPLWSRSRSPPCHWHRCHGSP